MSALTLQFHRGGVFLPRLGLWLDAHTRQTGAEKVFVSHAHSDHLGAHREVILSAATARLMQARQRGRRVENILAFGEPRAFDGGDVPFQITLLPAGHILGSAMAFIEAGGESLLYTGDFKLRPGLTAELCTPRRADVLIMETTFGQPRYVFPPPDTVWREVIRFCHDTVADGATPVLLGYSLGKSQELLRGLAEASLPVVLHESAWQLTQIYEQFGVRFPAYGRANETNTRGKVLICPPQAARSGKFGELGPTRTAVVTGWAVEASCRFRYQADAAFPLSDHADFPELIELVQQVRPKKVYTLHGFAADFAQALRERGFDAQALSEADQLHLPFDWSAADRPGVPA